MKRILITLLASIFMVGASFFAPANFNSTVEVVYRDNEGNRHFCTGIVVGITRVLTSEHCVSREFEMRVDEIPARILKTSEDLALLDLPVALDKKVIEIGETPKVGDVVKSLGHAYGGPIIVLTRSVAGYVEGRLIIDGPLSEGMSGGPIVDVNDNLVGINQGTNPVVGIGCPIEEIKDFLK